MRDSLSFARLGAGATGTGGCSAAAGTGAGAGVGAGASMVAGGCSGLGCSGLGCSGLSCSGAGGGATTQNVIVPLLTSVPPECTPAVMA